MNSRMSRSTILESALVLSLKTRMWDPDVLAGLLAPRDGKRGTASRLEVRT